MKISTSGKMLVAGVMSAALLSSTAASTAMSSRSLASSAMVGAGGGRTGAIVAIMHKMGNMGEDRAVKAQG